MIHPAIDALRSLGETLPLASPIEWCAARPFRQEHRLEQQGSVLHYSHWMARPDRGSGCWQIDVKDAAQ